MIIYKILKEKDFIELETKGTSSGSIVDKMDGFIHFSTKEQLLETLKKHFNGEKKLILMAIDSTRVADNLRWEKSRKNKLFPHLFSNLCYDDALWFAPIEVMNHSFIMPSCVSES